MEQIEGRHPVLEALNANRPLQVIYLQKDTKGEIPAKILHIAREKSIQIVYKERGAMDELSEGRLHQGVIAITEAKRLYTPEEILAKALEKGEDPFLLILDGVEDPHNVGALMRTALAAGVHGMILRERRAAGLSPAVIKAAAGAYELMPVAVVTNISRTIVELQEKGLWIAGADLEGSLIYDCDLKGPLAVVVGAESKGISRLVKEKCDYLLKLPMKEGANSLNASVAGALFMYEVLRQRSGF